VLLRTTVDEQRDVVGDRRVVDEAIETEAADIRNGGGVHATVELLGEGVETSYGLSFELVECHRLLLSSHEEWRADKRDICSRSSSMRAIRVSTQTRRVELPITRTSSSAGEPTGFAGAKPGEHPWDRRLLLRVVPVLLETLREVPEVGRALDVSDRQRLRGH